MRPSHPLLLGLEGDDHPQYYDASRLAAVLGDYLLRDGSLPMTGDLDLADFNLVNVDALYGDQFLSIGTVDELTRFFINQLNGDIVFFRADGSTQTLIWDQSASKWDFKDTPSVNGVDVSLDGHTHAGSGASLASWVDLYEDGLDSTLAAGFTKDVNLTYNADALWWEAGATRSTLEFTSEFNEHTHATVELHSLEGTGADAIASLYCWGTDSTYANHRGQLALQGDGNIVLYSTAGGASGSTGGHWDENAMQVTLSHNNEKAYAHILGADPPLAWSDGQTWSPGTTIYWTLELEHCAVTRIATGLRMGFGGMVEIT